MSLKPLIFMVTVAMVMIFGLPITDCVSQEKNTDSSAQILIPVTKVAPYLGVRYYGPAPIRGLFRRVFRPQDYQCPAGRTIPTIRGFYYQGPYTQPVIQ